MSALSKEQIVDIMLQLYDASKDASSWLEFYMEPNSDAELEKYKKAVRNQFYGRNGFPKNPSFRECNKLITAFKKLISDSKPRQRLLSSENSGKSQYQQSYQGDDVGTNAPPDETGGRQHKSYNRNEHY